MGLHRGLHAHLAKSYGEWSGRGSGRAGIGGLGGGVGCTLILPILTVSDQLGDQSGVAGRGGHHPSRSMVQQQPSFLC